MLEHRFFNKLLGELKKRKKKVQKQNEKQVADAGSVGGCGGQSFVDSRFHPFTKLRFQVSLVSPKTCRAHFDRFGNSAKLD